MKKHLDWKRVGWTVGIPIIILISIFGIWALGNWVAGNEIADSTYANGYSSVHIYFLQWGAGLATIISPFIAGFIIYIIYWVYRIIKSITNFYYHNGEGKK